MAFISDNDRQKLIERFDSELDSTVKVKLFSEPGFGLFVPGRRTCVSCAETEELLKEVASLSDRIELDIQNVRENPDEAREWGITLTPTIAVYGEEDSGVRILGLPGGYEFLSFLETMISASKRDGFGLRPDTQEKLNALDSDIEIKVFSTPT
jgi:alkyl hydroperoxide reductase subunit AhpF